MTFPLAHPTVPMWPEAESLECARLWALGWTASAIAKQFGRTRNSVIGRVNRMKLPQRDAPTDKHDSSKSPNRVKRAKTRREADTLVATRKAIWLPRARSDADCVDLRAPLMPKPPLPPPMPVRFLDRLPGQCAWPLWRGGEPLESKFVCGNHTIAGASYCAGCAVRSSVPIWTKGKVFIPKRAAA